MEVLRTVQLTYASAHVVKRKVEKFIENTIVIKNPVPDELIKTPEIQQHKNLFINKTSQETIIYPRIGTFEVYLYNILISSKLLTGQWPNHYKILQTLTKMIEEKKKGNPLDHFSIYSHQQGEPNTVTPDIQETTPSNDSPERRNLRIVSKKKKTGGLTAKAYKSIDQSN